MKRVMVRYRVKPDRLAEHEVLIADVFRALSSAPPAGLSYRVLKEADGLSFVHLATVSTANGENPLTKLPAFRAFSANVKDRCDVAPATVEVTELAAYPTS